MDDRIHLAVCLSWQRATNQKPEIVCCRRPIQSDVQMELADQYKWWSKPQLYAGEYKVKGLVMAESTAHREGGRWCSAGFNQVSS